MAQTYDQIYSGQLNQATQAVAPQVGAYQAQIPIVQQQFGQQKSYADTQKTNLANRYQSTLADIGYTENKEIDSSQKELGQRFGQRGLSVNDNLFTQTNNTANADINHFYTNKRGEAYNSFNESDSSLNNIMAMLPLQEQETIQKIMQQITGIQSGASQNAVTAAQNIYAQQQADYNAEQNRQATLKAANIARPSYGPTNPTPGNSTPTPAANGQVMLPHNNKPLSSQQTTSLLTTLRGNAQKGGDIHVDRNELTRAVDYLASNGYPTDQAEVMIENFMKAKGLVPYQW